MYSFVIHTRKTWRRVDGGQHHKFIRGWNWLLETSQVPLWYLWLISVYEWKPSTSKDTHGNPYTSRLWSTWLKRAGNLPDGSPEISLGPKEELHVTTALTSCKTGSGWHGGEKTMTKWSFGGTIPLNRLSGRRTFGMLKEASGTMISPLRKRRINRELADLMPHCKLPLYLPPRYESPRFMDHQNTTNSLLL